MVQRMRGLLRLIFPDSLMFLTVRQRAPRRKLELSNVTSGSCGRKAVPFFP
jgi:hypothetical protein